MSPAELVASTCCGAAANASCTSPAELCADTRVEVRPAASTDPAEVSRLSVPEMPSTWMSPADVPTATFEATGTSTVTSRLEPMPIDHQGHPTFTVVVPTASVAVTVGFWNDQRTSECTLTAPAAPARTVTEPQS